MATQFNLQELVLELNVMRNEHRIITQEVANSWLGEKRAAGTP